MNLPAEGVDLVPRLLYGRSQHVDCLIESGVARPGGLVSLLGLLLCWCFLFKTLTLVEPRVGG